MKIQWVVGLVAGVVLVGLLGARLVWVGGGQQTSDSGAAEPTQSESGEGASADDGRVVIGGIRRPATDVQLDRQDDSPERTVPKVRQGFAPTVEPADSPSAAGLYEALADRQQPSRFTSLVAAGKFDEVAYRQDPQAYLDQIEPGRVYAPAQPGPDVPVLSAAGKRLHRVVQGESVRLRVKAVAGAPVTFSAPQLGQFENQLTSITVRAGDDGVAEAVFTASGGTIDYTPVLAASPMASGQVAFNLLARVP